MAPTEQTTRITNVYYWLRNGSHLKPKDRRTLYIATFITSSLFIWITIGVMLALSAPQYASKWILIIPSVGKGHSVNLDSIGQASATATTPFSSSNLDPKVNYKHLALSQTVLKRAASKLDMSEKEFGKPRIKLVDQTSMMNFEVTASTGELAQQKSIALYQSFQEQLDILRDQEAASLVQASIISMEEFSEKLETSQKNKLNYQIHSGILSLEQFNLLIHQLEQKRQTNESLKEQLKNITSRIEVLLQGTQLETKHVNKAIMLRNDPVFTEQLNRHADIHTQMASIQGIWGKDHPQYHQLRRVHETVNAKLTARGRELVNDHHANTEQLIEWGANRLNSHVLTQLLTLISEQAGLKQQLEVNSTSITQLQRRIEDNADDAVHLEDLARKQQVATAVFTTALARQDIGKSDRFASYPMVQLLAEPSLPNAPKKMKKVIALAGGAVANLTILLGLGLLWIRKPFFQKIQKNASSGMD